MPRLIAADKVSFHAIGLTVWVLEKPQPKVAGLAPLPVRPPGRPAEIAEAIVDYLILVGALPDSRRRALAVMLARYIVQDLSVPWRLSGAEIVAYLTGKMSASELLFWNATHNLSPDVPTAQEASPCV